MLDYFEIKGYKFEAAKGRYKTKLQIGSDAELVEMTIKVLKAGEEKVCIDFSRTGGDQIKFYEQFNDIKDYLGSYIDASA